MIRNKNIGTKQAGKNNDSFLASFVGIFKDFIVVLIPKKIMMGRATARISETIPKRNKELDIDNHRLGPYCPKYAVHEEGALT